LPPAPVHEPPFVRAEKQETEVVRQSAVAHLRGPPRARPRPASIGPDLEQSMAGLFAALVRGPTGADVLSECASAPTPAGGGRHLVDRSHARPLQLPTRWA
jgi:hypothetical protein